MGPGVGVRLDAHLRCIVGVGYDGGETELEVVVVGDDVVAQLDDKRTTGVLVGLVGEYGLEAGVKHL